MGIFKVLEKKISEFSFKFFEKLKDVKGFFKCNVNEELFFVKQVEMRRDLDDQRVQFLEMKLLIFVKCEGVMNYLMNLESGMNIEDFFWQKC